MGSPLRLTLANAILCLHKKQCLDDCPMDFRSIVYRRYTDDCFLLFKENRHVDLLLNYFNTNHSNIEFIVEHKVDNTLPFLDDEVTRLVNQPVTDVFRKETFPGTGLKFLFFVPHLSKVNSIKTFVYRVYSICSSWENFDLEINSLSNYFTMNSYPSYEFEKIVKGFLINKLDPTLPKPIVEKQIKNTT